MWKFGFGVSCLISILIAVGVSQKAQFEGAMLDIVLLLDESGSVDDTEFKQMMNVARTLPDYFPIGSQSSHVALVAFATDAIVRHNFTDNITVFQEALEKEHKIRLGRPQHTHTDAAFKVIREVVLPSDRRPDVTNVVILLTDGCTDHDDKGIHYSEAMSKAVDEANMLLKECIIFLVYVGVNKCSKRDFSPEEHQWHLVGNISSRRIAVENFTSLTPEIFNQMKEQIVDLHCNFTEECYYSDDEKKKCVGEKAVWRVDNCIAPKLSPADCTVEKCELNCKNHWLNENDDSCSKWCTNPGSKECVACERCRKRSATVTIENVETTGPNAGGKDDPKKDGGGKSGSDSSLQWVYIGIAIGVGLLLVMLLIFAFVVVRKRRQRSKRRAGMMAKSETEKSLNSPISTSTSKSESKFKSKSKSESKNVSKSKEKSKAQKSESRKPSTNHGRKTFPPSSEQTLPSTSEKFRPTSRAIRKTLTTEPDPSTKHHRHSSTTRRHDKKIEK